MGGYTTEYAKSGRSTCKGCNNLIAQGELRVAKMVKSPHFDGDMPLWHHRKCIFKREVIVDASLISGLDNLRPEDQKSLKDQIAGLNTGNPAAAIASSILLDTSADNFTVEYAKSNRSACKHCGEKIEKDLLRVGKITQSTSFDGMMTAWHHLECVFKACVIFSAALVAGINDLRPDDQAEFKALVAKYAVNKVAASDDVDMKPAKGSKKKAATKKRGRKNSSDDDESEDEDEPASKAAKTSATDFSKMKVAELTKQCQDLGLPTKGKKADLIARLEEAEAASAPAAAASSSNAKAAAPVDPVKARHDAAIEAEGKQRWTIKDAVADISNNEIKQLLIDNSQPATGGRDKLMDALVDGLMYGALPPCPECGNQALTFSHGQYACHGMASEWGRCVYKVADVKRTKFDVSSYGGDIDYFASYKFKALKKPLEAHAYLAGLQAAASEQHKAAAAAAEESIKARQVELRKEQVREELFNDLVFVFVGAKFATHSVKELKDLVKTHGGEVTNEVDDADLIVTTSADVASGKNKKLKEGLSDKKPVVGEKFILDSISKLELAEPKDYSEVNEYAADWDDICDKVVANRAKSGATLSGGANQAAANTKSGLGKSGSGKAKLIIKGRGAVDEDSGLAESGHILEEGSDVFTQTLSITDLTTGTNSYYILQLIQSDSGSQYHVFRKWGRTGTDRGSSKVTDHGRSKESAKAEFFEVYLDKTGNRWSDRARFVKKPGKFNVVDVDYSASGDDPFADEEEESGESKSKLDARIQDIIKIFFDVKAIKKTLMSMEIDLDKMPLGKLSRAHIQSGYGVLTDIQNELKAAAPSEGQLLALSNKFFTLIPSTVAQVLRTEEQIKEKIEMIETLLEIEVATRMLKESKEAQKADAKKTAAAAAESNDPIDVHYRQLKTDMAVVEKTTDEFKLIKTYITNTHASTHRNYTLDLLEAFDVDRHQEADRYKAFENNSNRMLLWHGSRTSNFVGILSQGLRIAPPEAPVTGYMFGKGVYFADMVSKSANYTFTSSENNIGFLLLCEVALGDMNLLTHAQYMDKAPGKCLSTKGIGKTSPDPKGNVVLDNGCVVPSGKAVTSTSHSSLLYNEFIVLHDPDMPARVLVMPAASVYDVSQIRMKYLLKVRFNYQQRW